MRCLAFLKRCIPGIVLGVLLLAGEGGLMGLRAQRPPVPARRHVVAIRDFQFEPAQLTVAPGDTVVWVNRDIVPHTATEDEESWDSSALREGESWSLVARAAGDQTYHCRFHPAMKGVVLVR